MKSNTEKGRDFQLLCQKCVGHHFSTDLELEVSIPIGDPPKLHRFDCVSRDRKIVVECKRFSWTSSGNVPSAKLTTLNEALFYMSYLPKDTVKVLCVMRDVFPGKDETLAQYYCRNYGHLLRDVNVFELDDVGTIRVVYSALSGAKINW